MRSQNIFNTDIVSGHTIYADIVQSTGGKVYNNSNLEIKENLYVGENALISGTIHVDQDAVLKSKLYVEDDLNVGENTQLSGTIHVDQDAVFRSGLFVEGNAQINGNLYVSGDRVIMETSTVRVEDKNIELAVLDSATDATADQGGITLKGTTDKTILWSNATDSWDLSENLGIADGKYIFSDKLRARDSAGLSLEDDGGNGIFIEDGGNIGINTTSPSDKLDINGNLSLSNNSKIRWKDSLGNPKDTLRVDDKDELLISNNTTGNGGNIIFRSKAGFGESMTIDADGNVGIGTTDPKVIHHISTATQTDNYAVTRLTADSQQFDVGVGGSSAAIAGVRNKFYIYDSTDGSLSATRLVMDGAGNVGIGTSSPNEKLDLNGILYLRNSTVPSTTTNRLYASGGNLFWNGQNVLDNVDTWRAISSTPADGATTTSISSDWAFDNVKTAVPANAVFTDTNTWRAISSTPTNGATTTSISSDWAFDNVKTAVPANAVFTDTVPTFSYNSTTKTLTITT